MFSTSLLASALTHTILLHSSSSFHSLPIFKSSKQFSSWERSHHLFATDATKPANDGDCDCPPVNQSDGPDILKPFLPAMDPKYSVNGPVGQEHFIVSRTGPPTPEELSNEQMLKIVKIECNDLEVNTLVWKCMGYRFNEETESWDSEGVFPNWREKYPTTPDLIGMQRVYEREVDQISLRSNQALVRSIPADNKQSLKKELIPLGWTGYQVSFGYCSLCKSSYDVLMLICISEWVDWKIMTVQRAYSKQNSTSSMRKLVDFLSRGAVWFHS